MHRIPSLLVIQLRALSVFAIAVISQRCRLQLKANRTVCGQTLSCGEPVDGVLDRLVDQEVEHFRRSPEIVAEEEGGNATE